MKKVGNPIDLQSLLGEIYINSVSRKEKLDALLKTTTEFVTDISAAVNLLPEITKLQQVAINNDDALVKLAALVVKSTAKKSDNEDSMFELSNDEFKQLMSKAKQVVEHHAPSESK
jgi:hypothetical protein